MANEIQVYGTDWCGLTFSIREFLMKSRVAYDYYNIEQDPSADAFVRARSDGRRHFPLVVVEDEIITDPTLKELQRVLSQQRLSPVPASPNSRPRIHALNGVELFADGGSTQVA